MLKKRKHGHSPVPPPFSIILPPKQFFHFAPLTQYIFVYSCRAKPDSCRGHLTATNGRDGAETPGEGRGKYKDNETSVGCERDLHATA
jgi:hypothetical protein